MLTSTPFGPFDSNTLGEAGFTQRETLSVWEENCCLAYATISRWVNAERVQYLEPMAGNQTRYYTYERTSGILAAVVRRIYGRRIVIGFTANGLALKRRAEARHDHASKAPASTSRA